MADSYPPFTTTTTTTTTTRPRPLTRANSIYRNRNTSTYTRFVCKLLFFVFFVIAIPLFPSQAPDFINQTILNKFWELVHLMFIGIAVSYGLFCRRNVDSGNNVDDSQLYVSGMMHVSSFFEDGFDHSIYYSSGLGKARSFDVKNGSFENPSEEENVVQAWSAKYFQGEPMVVLAQPNGGFQKYGESGSYVGYKPLGLPVRSLKTRFGRVSPEFGDGSSESSVSSVKDLSDCSNESRTRRFSDLGSENLEGTFNENDISGSSIPWRSRSERRRDRVHGDATRPSHFRPLSADETQFESLKSRSLRSTVSPSSLSPSHSNSSESPKSKLSELAEKRSIPCRSLPPTSPSIQKPMSSKVSMAASHSRKYSDGSVLGTNARKCFEDELKEFCDGQKDDSSRSCPRWSLYPTSPSIPKAMSSKVSMSASHSRLYSDGSVLETDAMKCFEDELKEFCDSQKDDSSSSPCQSLPPTSPSIPKPMSSKVSVIASHSQQYSDGSMLGTDARKCFEDELKEFCDSQRDDSARTSPRQSLPPSSPPIPKPISSKVSMIASHSRQYSDGSVLGTDARKCFEDELKEFCDSQKDDSARSSPCRSLPPSSPSMPKPMSSKVSMIASHSRQYSVGSVLGTDARKCFEDELKEFCDSQKDDSSTSKEWLSGHLKFDAKPAAAPSKASLRGKSVRTFRSFRASGSSIAAREAGEKHENHTKRKFNMEPDEVEEAYMGESEPNIGHNNLSVGFNRKNLGGDCFIPKPPSPENQNREKQKCPDNSAVDSREDSEDQRGENDDIQVSSDEETMSGTFSIAGSEVDRKAGEFIAKFKEQIRLQRTTSIDTPRGFDITGNFFR